MGGPHIYEAYQGVDFCVLPAKGPKPQEQNPLAVLLGEEYRGGDRQADDRAPAVGSLGSSFLPRPNPGGVGLPRTSRTGKPAIALRRVNVGGGLRLPRGFLWDPLKQNWAPTRSRTSGQNPQIHAKVKHTSLLPLPCLLPRCPSDRLRGVRPTRSRPP